MRETIRAEQSALAAEDASSFEAFFELEYDRLFGTMCLVTGSRAESEDIAQEAFVRVWSRWERVRGVESPAGYLYRTAFNVFRNRLRATKRAARGLLHRASERDPVAAVDDQATVLDALRRLPARARAAVVLTELLDYSSDEAAHMLGVRPSSVRSLATHGRAELRRLLEGTYE